MNVNNQSMFVLYSSCFCSSVVGLSVHALLTNKLSPQNKHFQEAHFCLFPLEIPDLKLTLPWEFQSPLSSEYQKAIHGRSLDILWNGPL